MINFEYQGGGFQQLNLPIRGGVNHKVQIQFCFGPEMDWSAPPGEHCCRKTWKALTHSWNCTDSIQFSFIL